MNEQERSVQLSQLAYAIEAKADPTEQERSFQRCHEAFGRIGSGPLPLWTEYFQDETWAVIRAIKEVGFSGLGERLEDVERWIRKVRGFDQGTPQLSATQENELASIADDFETLTSDRSRLLHGYATRYELWDLLS